MDNTLNLNMGDCIQGTYHLGYTTYTNVCTGMTTDVAMGILDWLAVAVVMVMGAFFVFFLALVIKEFSK